MSAQQSLQSILSCRRYAIVFHMLCRKTQSSDVHRTESVSVMDHEQTMGIDSRVSDQKQQNIFGCVSLFRSMELQCHPEQLKGGDHDWLIQIPVSTVQRGMLVQTLVHQDTHFVFNSLLNGQVHLSLKFTFVPNCTKVVNLLKFPRAIYKILC